MKNYLIIIMLFFVTISCNAQDKPSQSIHEQKRNKPEEKIIVNKEYDDEGNLIKFDSTYSYFYSNIDKDSTFGNSAFNNFNEEFFKLFPNIQKPLLDDMFFEDSLLSYDYYKNDFFSKRFQMNWERYQDLFKEMDSVKNKFYDSYLDSNMHDSSKL